jgi:acetate kinase
MVLNFLESSSKSDHNAANDGVISSATSRVDVRVIHTDEELMIARSVCHVLGLAISSEPMAETPATNEPGHPVM